MHIPVMTDSVIEYLKPVPGGIYIDCTLGEGGHSLEILRKSPGSTLIAIDRDEAVIEKAREKLSGFGERVLFFNNSFSNMKDILGSLEFAGVDGILFDLGVSSFQLDDASRGFSFMKDGPLDMRMSKDIINSAEYYINNLDERRLNEIIFRYGEERWARRIAAAIIRARQGGGNQNYWITGGNYTKISSADIAKIQNPPCNKDLPGSENSG